MPNWHLYVMCDVVRPPAWRDRRFRSTTGFDRRTVSRAVTGVSTDRGPPHGHDPPAVLGLPGGPAIAAGLRPSGPSSGGGAGAEDLELLGCLERARCLAASSASASASTAQSKPALASRGRRLEATGAEVQAGGRGFSVRCTARPRPHPGHRRLWGPSPAATVAPPATPTLAVVRATS